MSDRARIGPGGRVVIPAAYRKTLGLAPGDEVVLVLDAGEVHLRPLRASVARAQAIVRRYVKAGRSLSAELSEERRAEAKHE